MFLFIGSLLFFFSLGLNALLLKEKPGTCYLALTPICALSFELIKNEPKFLFFILLTFLLWQISLMDFLSLSVFSLYLWLYLALSFYALFLFSIHPLSRGLAFLIYTVGLTLYQRLRPEAIGEGDIIFIGATSLVLGLYYTSLFLLIAALSALLALTLRKIIFKVALNKPLPFFPFLALGTYLAYLALAHGWLLY